MPGGIDPHTHLSMPFSGTLACDDFERCAAYVVLLHTHQRRSEGRPAMMLAAQWPVGGSGRRHNHAH